MFAAEMGWAQQSRPGVALPEGVLWQDLSVHKDERGWLSEIFRADHCPGVGVAQWNVVQSAAGVLRGVHVHVHHTDYVVLLTGRVLFGLHDLRPGSATFRRSVMLEASADSRHGLLIPPGVAHGFYFSEASLLLQGVTAYWDPEDELACSWADPALALCWPAATPSLSERDASAGTLDDLRDAYRGRAGPRTDGPR
jgi:dTDP-4-dehydrorhamnose 3,5-epimerase